MNTSDDDNDLFWKELLNSPEGEIPVKEIKFKDSSLLSEARWHNSLKTLTVVFKTNGLGYSFFDVPSDVVEELFSAEKDKRSAGSVFTRKIKNKFPYKKLPPAPKDKQQKEEPKDKESETGKNT